MLCDGTNATINYTVGEDGSITDVSASPEGAEIGSGEHGVGVRFATGESVRINVRDDDGQLQVGADDRIHCDAGAPAVNTEIAEDADTGDRGDRGDRDEHRGDGRDDGSHHDDSRDGSSRGGDEDRGNQRHNGGDD